MSLRFFSAPWSTATLTAYALAELGVEHERVRLDIDAGDTRRPEFLALNPNGRVPVLVHDGVPIWESAAILLHLGEQFGVASGLYPPPGPRRGQAMAWIVWANVTLAEPIGRLSAAVPDGNPGAVQPGSRDWVPPERRDPSAAQRAREDLAGHLAILEAVLAERPYVLGDYTLVDTHLQGLVGYARSLDADLTPFPRVEDWLARCTARPAITAVQANDGL